MSRYRKTHMRYSRGDVVVTVVAVGIMLVCVLILAWAALSDLGGAL